jgi:hypothetical protein
MGTLVQKVQISWEITPAFIEDNPPEADDTGISCMQKTPHAHELRNEVEKLFGGGLSHGWKRKYWEVDAYLLTSYSGKG